MKKLLLAVAALLSLSSAQASMVQNLGPGYQCAVHDQMDVTYNQFNIYLFDMVFAPVAVNPPGAARIIMDNAMMFPTISLIDGQAMLQQGFAGLSITVEGEDFSMLLMNGQNIMGTYKGMDLTGECQWSPNVIRTVDPY
ncbi:MAG: hypothetical protein H6624_07260 [Bdellovibrionaceae bacterium]|nr:hypothetical protein [Pseudobdellovibrionaceae bacterium]